ncbi:urease accessory protein UreD [Dactylosporangium sp. NPDC000521]|uniref:urease accessory protein UreD n=1 Tax=Dactylosporangium sp. NPDC000521 TaxID=3363975 RepID=UPI0036AEC8A6
MTTPTTIPPELAPFQDQPAQLPAGTTGKHGILRLRLQPRRGRTELVELYRQTPLLVQQALHYDETLPDCACIVVVTTGGGVVQGDRYDIDIRLDDHARTHLTTQSATKLQQMDANHASQRQAFTLGEHAYLEYLPEPVIPYRGSRFHGHTTVVLPPTATALIAEIVLPGRTHHHAAEHFGYDLLSLTVDAARPDGRRLCGEKFVIAPGQWHPGHPAGMHDYSVLGSVWVLTPPATAEQIMPHLTAGTDPAAGWAAGAALLPNHAGLGYRILSRDTDAARRLVRTCWDATRRAVTGRPAPPPFAWR